MSSVFLIHIIWILHSSDIRYNGRAANHTPQVGRLQPIAAVLNRLEAEVRMMNPIRSRQVCGVENSRARRDEVG
jgi:hypothetical protein